MYTLAYGDHALHDPRSQGDQVVSGKCSLNINEAGSLKFAIPSTHPLFGNMALMSAEHECVLMDSGEEVFRGRVTTEEKDIEGVARIECEGQLAYLNDSVVTPYGTYESVADEGEDPEWTTVVPGNRHDYAEWLLSQHNGQTDAYKQFAIGINDLPDANITRSSTVYPSTKEEITDKLIGPFDCYVSAYMIDRTRYIDFRSDGGRDATQAIEFGKNLLDFAQTVRATDTITSIIPLGKGSDDKEFGLESVPDGPVGNNMTKVGDRILHEAGVGAYGIIVEKRTYDVATTEGLINACCNDLASTALFITSLEVTAADLSKINPSIERIRLGEWVLVSARPLNFEARLICVKVEIDIADPAATKYVLGASLPSLFDTTKNINVRIRQQESDMIERVRPIGADAKEAAREAAEAKIEAASKTRNWTELPTTPYAIGDTMTQGVEGDVLMCVSPRSADEEYDPVDWVPASKYTDDTEALKAKEVAEGAAVDAGAALDAVKPIAQHVHTGEDIGTLVSESDDYTQGMAAQMLAGIFKILEDFAEVASFSKDKITLGDTQATLDMCGGMGRIDYSELYKRLILESRNLQFYARNGRAELLSYYEGGGAPNASISVDGSDGIVLGPGDGGLRVDTRPVMACCDATSTTKTEVPIKSGDHVIVPLNQLSETGEKLFRLEGGGVKCLEAGTLLVSAHVTIAAAGTGKRGPFIWKNNEEIFNGYLVSTGFSAVPSGSKLIKVAADDVIYLKGRSDLEGSIIPDDRSTHLSLMYV